MRYYDIEEAVEKGAVFSFVIGGRGIGKTYSSLRYHAIDNDIIFLLVRVTEREFEQNVNKAVNPFKKLNSNFNREIKVETGDIVTFKEGDKLKGYGAPLSTFYNIRGLDYSDVKAIIIDEFMKEGQKITFDMFFAFCNLYETVNRNREIEGLPPVRVYFLANSCSLASPILTSLHLVPEIEMMLAKGQRRWYDPKRSIYVHLPYADVSEEKRLTALYKFAEGTEFINFALDNDFVYDSFWGVEKSPIIEYEPLLAIDDIYIWKHKSTSSLYVTYTRGDCMRYSSKDNYVQFYKKWALSLRELYGSMRIRFESYAAKTKFLEMVKWK